MSSAGNVGEQQVTGEAQPRPPQVFVSYSHKDKKWLERLQTHLAPLLQKDALVLWADSQIRAGQEWRAEIDAAIASARVAVLLVTPDFLASDFIAQNELPPLLKAAEERGLKVLWVAVSASLYEEARFSKYQAVNEPKRPLNSLSPANRDAALVEVARRIRDELGTGVAARNNDNSSAGSIGKAPPTRAPADPPQLRSTSSVSRNSGLWLAGGYFAVAVAAALVTYQSLREPLESTAWSWAAPVAVVLFVGVVLLGHAVPTLIERKQKGRLQDIPPPLKAGYFRLAPREDESGFARADNKHEEILRWVKESRAPVLYLTGQSGSGKSSILASWVIPRLSREEPPVKVIQLRGYQDPVSVLVDKLREPRVIWKAPPDDVADPRQLLERACRHIRPGRLVIIFDQFEEFVILHEETQRQEFANLLSSVVQNPINGLTVLLALRSDCVGLLDERTVPALVQYSNWQEVPPFTEPAADAFLRGSNLATSEEIRRNVLREAADIEGASGLIRPVTLNLCGLVLSRFSTGIPPRKFRPGRLIRGFLQETVELPAVRELTPQLIPLLMTRSVTKRPRTVAELAKETGLEEGTIRGCFRVLGQPERGIVRPLDREQNTWEISHDFLVRLLDSIFAGWSVSFWRRTRPYLPWIAAASMALVVVAVSIRPANPIAELIELGWDVSVQDKGGIMVEGKFMEPRWPETAHALRRLRHQSIEVTFNYATNVAGIEVIGEVKGISSLDLSFTPIADLSPFRELKSLTSLNLRSTKVTNLTPLRELTSLSTLNLFGTDVTDLTPLRELKRLSSLNLIYTQVTDLRPLRELKVLKSVHLSPEVAAADPQTVEILKQRGVEIMGPD